jgi:hypothetical protein
MDYSRPQGNVNQSTNSPRASGARRLCHDAESACLSKVQAKSLAPTRICRRSRKRASRRLVSRQTSGQIAKMHEAIKSLIGQIKDLNSQNGLKSHRTSSSFSHLHRRRIPSAATLKARQDFFQRANDIKVFMKMADPSSSSTPHFPLRSNNRRRKPRRQDESLQIINDLGKLTLSN